MSGAKTRSADLFFRHFWAASAEPEPLSPDGCWRWPPRSGDHLLCVRRLPASVSACGLLAAASRQRGLYHPGAAPLPIQVFTRFPLPVNAHASGGGSAGRGMSRAIAHSKATDARATATTPCWGGLPRAMRCRGRWHRRTCAVHLRSWRGWGWWSRRRGRWRPTFAG